MLRQLGPRRPTASFQSGRKERTQRSPARGPSAPPRTRGAISASLEGSHRDPRLRPASPPRSKVANLPSSGQLISASLEGSEPTLGGVTHLRFARGHPSAQGTNSPANHSSTVLSMDGVRLPFPTVAVTGVPSANSGHCSAIPDAVATLWEPTTWYETCST